MTSTQPHSSSYDAREIANKILHLAKESDISLTSMQLLKLVYLAHGWSLVMLDDAIVRNTPQAWQYGPVYPTIYKSVKKSGSRPITDMIADNVTGEIYFPKDISKQRVRFIETILTSYGRKRAFDLSSITHKEGTPWYRTYHEIGQYQDIPIDFMREHFNQLAEQRKIDTSLFREATS